MGKTFFRAVYFIPAVLSLLTVGIIFEKIYGTVLPAMGAYLEIDFLKKISLLQQQQHAMGS